MLCSVAWAHGPTNEIKKHGIKVLEGYFGGFRFEV